MIINVIIISIPVMNFKWTFNYVVCVLNEELPWGSNVMNFIDESSIISVAGV